MNPINFIDFSQFFLGPFPVRHPDAVTDFTRKNM